MTAVKISGTISKDARPDNGLEGIAEKIATEQFAQHVCVVVFEYHTAALPRGEAPIPTVRAVAIEPLDGEARGTAMQLLNNARKTRGQTALAGTLFDKGGGDQAEDDGPTTSRPADEWLDEPTPINKPKRSRTR